MKTKIVINDCIGEFWLSDEAIDRLNKLKDDNDIYLDFNLISHIARDDPALLRVVEELGEKANTKFSALKVVEIDSDKFEILSIDGKERVI